MAQACKVCAHPQLEDIERALVSGESLRTVAGRFGLMKDALHRHSQRHASPAVVPIGVRPQDDAAQLLGEVEQHAQIARALMRNAYEAKNTNAIYKAMQEHRRTLELLARLKGLLDTRPQVQVLNVMASSEWVELRGRIMAALEAHPEARRDVVTALGSESVS